MLLAIRNRRALTRRAAVSLLMFCQLLPLAGCPTPVDEPSIVQQEPPDDGVTTFSGALKVDLSSSDRTTIDGEIAAGGDVDLYEFGPLSPGDRIVIDVQTTSGQLDPLAALFDSREQVHGFNDDRASDGSNLNPLIDVIIRGPQGSYFLGVVAFPGSESTGRYRVDVQITRAVGIPQPEAQVVFLEWRGGGNIVIPNVGTYNLPPFDAVQLGKEFAGQTAAIKQRVEEIVADRFRGFNLILLNSDDDAAPAVAHSTIYFGGDNARAFAVSEQVDTFNADPGDDAIIFTNSYRGAFGITPSVEQISVALGNTVAHEIGHLLGLVHTKECSSLMDTRCGNQALLFEQSFQLAPLDDSVFPLGFQDAAELIGWAIGLVGL